MRIAARLFAVAAAVFCLASAAVAGPPYETDDPVPTDLHHWEIYAFAAGAGHWRPDDATAGFDFNYGVAKDLQLTATLPVEFARTERDWTNGLGDIEVGAKYRLVDTGKDGVQIAVFPRVILPTAGHTSGSRKARLLLPVWVQKDIDPWSVFGGGGYLVNPGSGNRDVWRAGLAVTWAIGDNLSVGGEAGWESADTVVGSSTASLGLGSIVHLGGPVNLLVSIGPAFTADQTDYHGYAPLGLAF